jgi:tetratricopeptide (TPR) repeat protein
LNISTNSAQGFFQLGLVQLGLNQFEAAAATFQAALRAKPDFGPAWFNYGYALARAGNVRGAIDPFREAIRHNPEHIDSYLLLADLHLQLNERDRASDLIRQARLIDPANPKVHALEKKMGAARN